MESDDISRQSVFDKRLMYHVNYQLSIDNWTIHTVQCRACLKDAHANPRRQRLSVFIGLILLCLVLTQFIELPTRSLAVTVLDRPLGVDWTPAG